MWCGDFCGHGHEGDRKGCRLPRRPSPTRPITTPAPTGTRGHVFRGVGTFAVMDTRATARDVVMPSPSETEPPETEPRPYGDEEPCSPKLSLFLYTRQGVL
jgi:hypothetical protein